MRLEETALSIRACSRKTLSRCGDCFVKSSCLPRASPRSAKYQAVVVGMLGFFPSSSVVITEGLLKHNLFGVADHRIHCAIFTYRLIPLWTNRVVNYVPGD